MVDVSAKPPTQRSATARATVRLPPEVAARLDGDDIATRKGPVFQTAILAGIQGAKQCGSLIPLCHPLPMEGCDIDIGLDGEGRVRIDCTARIHARTGVEMEALTGASIAALTVYDMCKAFSHDIVIEEIRLIAKSGGKRDFSLDDPSG